MKLTYENNPSEILDKLLEYHDIQKLRELLNKKGRKKKVRGNNYIDVAIDVYKLVYIGEKKHMLERAIDAVAEERSISDKTIKNHLRKFRKLFKNAIVDIEESDIVQTTQMIKELILSKYDWQNDYFYDIDGEEEIEEFVKKKEKQLQYLSQDIPF